MKIFHCDHCDNLVFFENIQCVSCGHLLAFLPDLFEIGSLEPAGEGGAAGEREGRWSSPIPGAEGRTWRLCENYRLAEICNWAVPDEDPNALCRSCRLTRVVPDLGVPGHREAWYRLEVAKRRVIYSLLNLGLPIVNRVEDPEHGLAFEFLADPPPDAVGAGAAPVLTGHANAVITINIAEADDAERERRKKALREPYRTLVGHVRHEIGHYYWDRLIARSPWLDAWRALFGDEREDYGQALQRHYAQGPPADWQDRFLSAYASAHPWEDWAETWAHYLHMTDALETAAACGVSIRPRRQGEPALAKVPASAGTPAGSFDRLIDSWYPLTYVLNNLNRGLGLPDGYPFVLPPLAVDKLRFVHELIASNQAPVRDPLSPSRGEG